jgi:hypothetical protein
MKTTRLLLLMLGIVSSAHAQLEPGSWYTGACFRVALNSSNSGDNHSTNFIINPGTFYTINDHWGAGGMLSYQTEIDKTGDDQKNTTSSYSVLPGVRYYGQISDRVNCYLQGLLGIGGGTAKYEYDGNESKTNNFSWGAGIRPGIMWNIRDRTYLDFSYGNLSYNHTTYKDPDTDDKSTSSDFLLDLNTWSLSLGLYYAFGGKKGEY